jgi:prepilin signal peptidase PulO-like enzyme (type II secretory pathway)
VLTDPEHGGAGISKVIEEEEDITLGNHYLPFGPYLCAGGLVYLFAGPEMLAAYIARAQAISMALLMGIV